MNYMIASLLLMVTLYATVPGQTTKRRNPARKPAVTTPPQPQPISQPTPTAQPVRPPAARVSLVVVNNQTFTTADLEPAVRQELEHLDDKIADARKSVLELQINTMLLDIEAKK